MNEFQLNISVLNLPDVFQDLDAASRRVKRSAVNAINRTATFARNELVKAGSAATGISKRTLRERHGLKRARLAAQNSRYQDQIFARVKPSSYGIPVPEYKWKHEETGKYNTYTTKSGESYSSRNPTRHRILVKWPGGWKVAAGFVNPFGQYRAPISTRLYAGEKLWVALGPSAATLFKQLATDQWMDRVKEKLRDEFFVEMDKL